MTTYPLAGPTLLDPFWFGKVRHGQHQAIVSNDGSTVIVEGIALSFRAARPAPGSPVRVWLNAQGFFVCAAEIDLDAEATARRAAQEAAALARRDRLNALRVEAEVFNARLHLPVKWDVGIKDALSGLSETSWGDGRSKATVEHVYLVEPLVADRLVRQAGDLLCTSAAGTNGKRWSSKVVERAYDGDGSPYQPKVTCQACLALAQRWIVEDKSC